AAIQGWRRAGPGRLTAHLSFESRDVNLVRTLPLASVFADTQERELNATGYRASLQYTDLELPIGIPNNLTIGADIYRGSLDSRYYQIALGDEATHRASQGGRQQLNNDGSAMRHSLAGYVHLDLRPVDTVKLTAGARYDRIADSFDAVEGLSEEAADATNTAFSPKVGLNVRYMGSEHHVGNVWVSASRSFKAPTLDQLYDLRAFPVPFPPFEIRIASPLLTPQEGTAFEAGIYHLMDLDSGWQGSASLTAYTMDMENEIDFSFETFSNVNIGKSSHKGVETGLSFGKPGLGSVFANHTLQDVTQQSGENKGNAVKAIPKHAVSAGLSAEAGPLGATLVWKSATDMWADDANTAAINDYSTVDLRLSWDLRDWRFTADVFNLLDEDFDTTAYPDPGGSDVLFLFPSAMRTLRFGAHFTF
ncbi:MAG: TonB-dependent receptor, partial [Bacteroidetes bacterium]|nr:TonB-dependent receptor [Bacteroidota bacterium]